MTRKERVISNLSQYPDVRKFLGNAVRKRLEIEGYTRGMLTAHLMDEPSEPDLTRLERVLQLGEKQCTDFKQIFKERELPNKDLAIDAEIINILAEVKAFEVLYGHHFEDIKKIRPAQEKTVDFTAAQKGQNFAVEVMRLSQSKKKSKKKEPAYLVNIENAKFTVKLIDGQDNIPIFKNIIRYAVQKKSTQITDFCQRQQGQWEGILFLSIGRDYFIANKYAAHYLFELAPRSTLEALKSEFDPLMQNTQNRYLKHIIITTGKYNDKVIIYPNL